MKPQVKFTASGQETKVILKIMDRVKASLAERGYSLGAEERLSLHMDIEACHSNGCPLRLKDLLAADDFNFSHDVFGIRDHIDRTTGRLLDHFVPRFAKEQ